MGTKKHIKYWKNRKIDWDVSYFNPDHFHRKHIIEALKRFKCQSVLELGCGAGANLYNINQYNPYIQVNGVDVNSDAIEMARVKNPNAHYLVAESAEDVFLGDKSIDIILTDACLLYYGPLKIKRLLKQIRGQARQGVVFCELNGGSMKWLKARKRGYYVHNYPKLLEKLGYFDINVTKIPVKDWPGFPWDELGYIISARV